MGTDVRWVHTRSVLALQIPFVLAAMLPGAELEPKVIRNKQLVVAWRATSYEIMSPGLKRPVLQARVGAEIDHRWLASTDYPESETSQSPFTDDLGTGRQLITIYKGIADRPSLICTMRLYDEQPFGSIQVGVRNSTVKPVSVEAIRPVDALGSPRIDLGAREGAERVLSDSFSEDRPTVHIYDLGNAPVYLGFDEFGSAHSDTHLAVGSQLVYNRQSRQSLLLGALTSRLWLTICRLRTSRAASGDVYVSSYAVDSMGTTDIQKKESLRSASAENQIELSLPLAPGNEIASERILFTAGPDYHAQLDSYGQAVKRLNYARVNSEAPSGWWSWATYYSGITDGLTLTNAQWLADHLKELGYRYILIDEGYQYARGEYTTLEAAHFPQGMRLLPREICDLGLKLGIWTAPFEVSQRAWVYAHHKDWLVHNAHGEPIQIRQPGIEPLYVLDTTHPAAQEYLRNTYQTLTHQWGVRYIKLDFMDDTAIEGFHYRPNTTALQAQRIGLEIIRKAVGNDVLIDKDGSPMLNPVGIVDEGRISTDTAHSFEASKTAATGIAARYYMHRNFFVNDPDAFTVSHQPVPDQAGQPPTLDEAEVSIALAAVSGSMYEIGDDLTRLSEEPERFALAKNHDLLQMIRLNHASVPMDLMEYSDEDRQPSIFVLHEDQRQTVLTVFNWTDTKRSHSVPLDDLRFSLQHELHARDVLRPENQVTISGGVLRLLDQPPHSVRMIEVVDSSLPPVAPAITVSIPALAQAGKPVRLACASSPEGEPALGFHWDFGDGTSSDGTHVVHTYTRAGTYSVRLVAEGVDGLAAQSSTPLKVSGAINTEFNFKQSRRFVDSESHWR